jgi:hypothetical protein
MTTLTTLTFNTAQADPLIFNGYTFNATNSPTNTIYTNTDGMTTTSNAWQNNHALLTVNFPTTITSIDTDAFKNASNMTTITFDTPSSLTTIGAQAFQNASSLTGIIIPNSVTSIGTFAFIGCASLTSVTFESGSNLASIGTIAFYGTKITSFTIPNTVTTMGTHVFGECTMLTSVTFAPTSPLTTISSDTFYSCTSLTSIAIPQNVTVIGNSAFNLCTSLTSVTFDSPTSLTTINREAFFSSGLTSITIPNTVTSIGVATFSGCSALTSISFEPTSTLDSINDEAFKNTGLVNVIIPNSVTFLAGEAFNSSSLQWVENSSSTLSTSGAIFPSSFNNASKTLYSSNALNPIVTYVQTNYPLTTIVIGPSCYNEDVNILTENGYRKINTLQTGDGIVTLNDGIKKIKHIHFQPFNCIHTHFGSTMFRKKLDNEFGEICVTGNHCILTDEYQLHMVRLKGKKEDWKIDGKYISVAGVNPEFEKLPVGSYNVYHIVLESDDVGRRYAVYANGILSESMSLGHYNEIRNIA